MNKARAMLDALMGPGRDEKKDANAKDWTDRSVCRSFLVGFCPLDKANLGGKRKMEPCAKIHSEVIKAKFEASDDAKEDCKFRVRCEEIMLNDIEYVIGECEKWVRSEKERIRKEPKPRRLPPEVNVKILSAKKEITQLRLKAATLDDADHMLKEQLIKQADTMAEDIEAYQKEEEKKAADAAPLPVDCEVCGTFYLGQEEYDRHMTYRIHDAYVQAREKLKALKEKKAEREASEKEKRDEERKRKNEEAIKKNETGEDGEKESRGRDKEKDKKADGDKEGRKRSRSREKDKDRRKTSRSREKERSRSRGKDKAKGRRSPSRDRERGRKERARSRSRSRSNRRGKDRDRKRSRSRSRRRR